MPLQQGVIHEQYHSQGRFAGPMCHLQPLLARRVVWINELEFQIYHQSLIKENLGFL